MRKILNILVLVIMLIFILTTSVSAASIGFSKAEVDSNVSVTVSFGQKVGAATVDLKYDSSKVTYVGVNKGKANNSNGNVKVVFFDSTGGDQPISSITFTFKAKATGNATFSASISGMANPDSSAKFPNASTSNTVTIKEKVVTQTPAATPATTPTTSSNKEPQKTTNKNNNTTKTTTTKKTETTKKQIPEVETKEQEEATPQWGINDVKLVGIKENDERVDLELDKKFDINTFEYTCNVSSDIKKIEVQKEAYEYNEYVTITGLEEELKDGENVITLKLAKEGQKELNYVIKVNKEAKPEESMETNAEPEIQGEQSQKLGINMPITLPLWGVILIELVTIIVSVGITILAIVIRKSVSNGKEEIQEENKFEKLD